MTFGLGTTPSSSFGFSALSSVARFSGRLALSEGESVPIEGIEESSGLVDGNYDIAIPFVALTLSSLNELIKHRLAAIVSSSSLLSREFDSSSCFCRSSLLPLEMVS